MSTKTISEMSVKEIFEATDRGMAEVGRCLNSGELNGSGRYYTDEELVAQREQYKRKVRGNGAANGAAKEVPEKLKAAS
jgi:hypothetical protein